MSFQHFQDFFVILEPFRYFLVGPINYRPRKRKRGNQENLSNKAESRKKSGKSQKGQESRVSGIAPGAAKTSCGETVVQKGVFGESVSSLPP